MFRTKTLNDITYKDKWYKIGSPIDVDDKDVDKLVKLVAIPAREKTEVVINVIKNPIKVEKIVSPELVEMVEEANTKVEKETEKEFTWETNLQGDSGKVKRKYNRRDKEFRKRR